MHVSGLGSVVRLWNVFQTWNFGAEVVFAEYLDLSLRLSFIPSSRWSTGKCFLFPTNSSYPKRKARFASIAKGERYNKEALIVYWSLMHMENMNSLASYFRASRNSEFWHFCPSLGSYAINQSKNKWSGLKKNHTTKNHILPKIEKQKGDLEILQRWCQSQGFGRDLAGWRCLNLGMKEII